MLLQVMLVSQILGGLHDLLAEYVAPSMPDVLPAQQQTKSSVHARGGLDVMGLVEDTTRNKHTQRGRELMQFARAKRGTKAAKNEHVAATEHAKAPSVLFRLNHVCVCLF